MSPAIQSNTTRTYFIASDAEVIPLDHGEWMFRSATRASKISGSSSALVIEQIVPLLKKGCTQASLEELIGHVDPCILSDLLQQLVSAGVVKVSQGDALATGKAKGPLLNLLEELNIPAHFAEERISKARVAIVGLESTGAYLAQLLVKFGIRRFTLVDPFPCQAGDLSLLPTLGQPALGLPRQILVAQTMRADSSAPHDLDIKLGPAKLSQERLHKIVKAADLVISCFDRGFSKCHHWVNRASLRARVPALYAEATGHQGWAGPLVLTQQTACYMCYRMRVVACAADSGAALAYEAHLDRQDLPRSHDRAVLPSLAPQLAGVLATSALQVILGMQQPALAGYVVEYNAFSGSNLKHPVLQQPDCPDCACAAPSSQQRHPDMEALLAQPNVAANREPTEYELVSPATGIIREIKWYEKDAAEPEIPYICQVRLANYRFQSGVLEDDLTCWGKGFTLLEARARGIGEALERYAADRVDYRDVAFARRADLTGPSLDPSELVLYAREQYEKLPYHPYKEESVIGWVQAKSLTDGNPVYIPAIAAYLGYEAQSPGEHLFSVTSNGLAAGPSISGAILSAAYEVLERDAFMIAWLARMACLPLDPASHPDPGVRAFCASYKRRGVNIRVWQLPTDHDCSVVLAMGLQQDGLQGPSVVAGLGADLNLSLAARKAILEVGQIRPSYRRSLRRPSVQQHMAQLVADPSTVSTMHDHGLLYCSFDMRHALDFLLGAQPGATQWPGIEAQPPQNALDTLVNHFRQLGREIIYYNLTPPDLEKLGISVVRVILPGFQPVAFGAQEQRLGGARLYKLPMQLGFAAARLTLDDLNPYPHPFD